MKLAELLLPPALLAIMFGIAINGVVYFVETGVDPRPPASVQEYQDR